MKRSRAPVLFLAILASSAEVGASVPDPLIKLHHEIAGPAWKMWSLRLEANGKIVEVHTDYSSGYDRREQTRCKLTPVASGRAVEASIQLLDSLPARVVGGRGSPLDGPYKQLIVRRGSEVRSSRWYSPKNTNRSVDEKEFVRAWKKIQALLACGSRR